MTASIDGALHARMLEPLLRSAFAEDLGQAGDLTTEATIGANQQAAATIAVRADGVVAGLPVAQAAFGFYDPSLRFTPLVSDGDLVPAGTPLATVEGSARSLLTAERTALNFLQLLSAVATKTALYVEAVRGTRAQIVDTRKTLPGLRMAQKYAVRTGGGVNHRIGLYDAVLIKENHIAAAGGVAPVLQAAAGVAAQASFVEIEVETLAQLEEALAARATMILLDNMELPTLREAVRFNAGRAILEISGGVTLTVSAPSPRPASTASPSVA